MNKLSLKAQTTEFLLYTAPSGQVKVEYCLINETLWLTQKRMAELFGVGVPAISKHLENIYESGELQLFPFWKLFNKKASAKCLAGWNITTLMPLFQWVIVSIHHKQPSLEFGRRH